MHRNSQQDSRVAAVSWLIKDMKTAFHIVLSYVRGGLDAPSVI